MNEVTETEVKNTFVKKHATKIKVAAGVVVGTVVGGVIAVVVLNRSEVQGHMFKTSNTYRALVHIGKNEQLNVVTTELERRHNPGLICKDVKSGVVAASKSHLSGMLGVSRKTIDNMIEKGEVEILGESA